MKKVIVLGAGPGGLAASLLLAKAGFQVTVIERLPRVGGRTSALEVEGFRFDRGPTFFLYPRILKEIFAALGRDLFEEVPMTRLDPQYRLVFDEGYLDATPRVEAMQEQIARFAPHDADNLHRFLKENRSKLENFAPILETAFPSWRRFFTWELLKMLPQVKPWRSVDGELKRFFSDPRIRLAFGFQSKYLGMSPFQCPSLFTILSFLEYEHGVFHPEGGCARVSERMAEIAAEMGVEFRLEEEVQELLVEGGRAVGVLTNRERLRADAVVVNADFARAVTRLVPSRYRRRWSDRRVAAKRFSCSTFMLYLGIRGQVDLPHHTIYFSRDYHDNILDITQRFQLPQDPSFYIQNPGVTDSTLAPEGHSALYLLVPVPHMHQNIDWGKERDDFRRLAYRQLARVGLPDLDDRVVVETMVTPEDWQQRFEIYRGATFSMAHNLGQMLCFRPPNRFDDIDGVYLVGGGTHPGSGLPVIYSSARITADLMCEDFGLSTRFGRFENAH